MKISALASGSNGNCFYINNGDSSIIVDSGISCKQVEKRLNYLGEDPNKIKGIFVTHEHHDHVKGVDVLSRKYNIPIFATRGTINNSLVCSNEELINEIKNDEIIKLAGLEIEAFSKPHDAADPVSFAIRNGKMISILTDIGHASKNVIGAVENSDFLVIETNHDLKMLQEGPYPYFLKRRIEGEVGHFSNFNSAACVLEHSRPKLKNVMLAHLSEINNTPQLAFQTFNSLMKERIDLHPKITLSLKNPTPLFKI